MTIRGGNIKVNLPQPGETKAQFMTRSVRLLMKSGKSKTLAIGIAERIWNNTAQSTNIQPNDVNANVSFQGVAPRRSNTTPRGQVAVKQIDSFRDFSNKLNESKMNSTLINGMNSSQSQFLNDMKDMLKENLVYPLSSILKNSTGPNLGVRNYNNLPTTQSDFQFQQMRSQQQQLMSAIGNMINIQQHTLQELTTIRSVGMKVRRTVKTATHRPRMTDFWDGYRGQPGQFNNAFINTFLQNIEGEHPTIDKIANIARIIVNPIQSFRGYIGNKIRSTADKFRRLTGDLSYKYQDDPEQLMRDAGVQVLDSERLSDKINTEIIPQKLAELTDDNKQQIDILRNIYLVNRDHLAFVSQGNTIHQYQKTIDDSKHVFDRTSGRYFTEKEMNVRLKSITDKVTDFIKIQEANRRRDPLFQLTASLNRTIFDPLYKLSTDGATTGRINTSELPTIATKAATPWLDQDLINHELETKYQKYTMAIDNFNRRGAATFSPLGISNPYNPIDYDRENTINNYNYLTDEQLKALGDNAFRRRHDGTYILDKNGKRQYRHHKDLVYDENGNLEFDENGVVKLRHGNYAKDNGLIYDKYSDPTNNPFTILKDLTTEIRNVLHVTTTGIHQSINDDSPFILRWIKNLTPQFKKPKDVVERKVGESKGTVTQSGTAKKDIFDDILRNINVSSTNPPINNQLSLALSNISNQLKDNKYFVINTEDEPLHVKFLATDITKILEDAVKKEPKKHKGGKVRHTPFTSKLGRILHLKHNEVPIVAQEGETVVNSAHSSPSRISTNTDVKTELDRERLNREQIARDGVQKKILKFIKGIYTYIQESDLDKIHKTIKNIEDKKKPSIFKRIFDWLKKIGSGLLGLLGLKKLPTLLKPLLSPFVKGFSVLKAFPGKVINAFKTGGQVLLSLPGQILGSLKSGGKYLASIPGKVIGGITNAGKHVLSSLSDTVPMLKSLPSKVTDLAKNTVSSIGKGAKNTYEFAKGLGKSASTGIVKSIDFASNALTKFGGIIKDFGKGIISLGPKLGSALTTVGSGFTFVLGKLGHFTKSMLSLGKSLVVGGINTAGSAVSGAVGLAATGGKSIWNGIKNIGDKLKSSKVLKKASSKFLPKLAARAGLSAGSGGVLTIPLAIWSAVELLDFIAEEVFTPEENERANAAVNEYYENGESLTGLPDSAEEMIRKLNENKETETPAPSTPATSSNDIYKSPLMLTLTGISDILHKLDNLFLADLQHFHGYANLSKLVNSELLLASTNSLIGMTSYKPISKTNINSKISDNVPVSYNTPNTNSYNKTSYTTDDIAELLSKSDIFKQFNQQLIPADAILSYLNKKDNPSIIINNPELKTELDNFADKLISTSHISQDIIQSYLTDAELIKSQQSTSSQLPLNNINMLQANMKQFEADEEQHKIQQAINNDQESNKPKRMNEVDIKSAASASPSRLSIPTPVDLSNAGGITPIMSAKSNTARHLQESVRVTDPFTENIITRIFSNTMFNFQQGSNNYALGNNPMTPVHII